MTTSICGKCGNYKSVTSGSGALSNVTWCQCPSDERKATERELRVALQKIIDRWDTPLWKDVGPTADVINEARKLLRRGSE